MDGSSLEATLASARAGYAAKRPASHALHDEAVKSLPGGNTRSVLGYGPFPIAMASGRDARLLDVDGIDYLDLCGEYSAGLFGHSNKPIHAAITAALGNGLNLSAVGANEQKLARLLSARFPSMEMLRFTNSGTEAGMLALLAAQAFTGRSKVLVFRGAYHGSMLTFPLGDTSSPNIPFPYVLADYNDMDATARVLADTGGELAAVMVEPMMGSGGCLPAGVPFLAMLREHTARTGTVLVFDEVQSSRMSAGGLQQRTGVVPDMTTLGKYVGGGMSFGAFGGRRGIMQQFAASISHSGTFNNNVLTMSAGVVAMGEVFTPDVAEALYHRGEALRDAANRVCANRGAPMCFTGAGSIMAPHFRRMVEPRPYLESDREAMLRELFFFDMLEAGIYLSKRGMTALSLPVDDADTDAYLAAIEAFASRHAASLAEYN